MNKNNMKYIIPESKMESILHKLLNMEFEGFDDVYYSWANYNCGMGECCDPYAIGFVLPKNNYDDYLFKLVDGTNYSPDPERDYPTEFREDLPEPCYESPDVRNPNFDTYIGYSELMENIESYLGHSDNWKEYLLNLLNRTYLSQATNIIFI